MPDVQPYQVDAVVKFAQEITPDRHAQLTLLTASLVILARCYGIKRSSCIEHVKRLFGRPAEVKSKGISITGANDDATRPQPVA